MTETVGHDPEISILTALGVVAALHLTDDTESRD